METKDALKETQLELVIECLNKLKDDYTLSLQKEKIL